MHWTKIVVALCVLVAVVPPAREAQAQRRKRMEIPECAKVDLLISTKKLKEAEKLKPRCTAALKAEAAKPDTPRTVRVPQRRTVQAPPQRPRYVPVVVQRAPQGPSLQQLQAQRVARQRASQEQQQAQQIAQAREQQRQAQLSAQVWQQRYAAQLAQEQAASQQAQRAPAAPAPAAPPGAPSAPPSTRGGVCYESTQGKIAWDRAGSMQWSPVNIAKLCAGAEDSVMPGQCFADAMRSDANRQWPEAIEMCSGKRAVCSDSIQGKIAWDRAGNVHWSPANIAKLCAGAEDSVMPGQCFADAMRSDTNRQWPQAIEMCAGKR